MTFDFSCLFMIFLSAFLLHYFTLLCFLHSFPTRRSSDLPLTPFCGVAQNTMCPIMHRIPLPALSLSVLPGEYRSLDRKSTRLNSSHVASSYAVFCLKKKKRTYIQYEEL